MEKYFADSESEAFKEIKEKLIAKEDLDDVLTLVREKFGKMAFLIGRKGKEVNVLHKKGKHPAAWVQTVETRTTLKIGGSYTGEFVPEELGAVSVSGIYVKPRNMRRSIKKTEDKEETVEEIPKKVVPELPLFEAFPGASSLDFVKEVSEAPLKETKLYKYSEPLELCTFPDNIFWCRVHVTKDGYLVWLDSRIREVFVASLKDGKNMVHKPVMRLMNIRGTAISHGAKGDNGEEDVGKLLVYGDECCYWIGLDKLYELEALADKNGTEDIIPSDFNKLDILCHSVSLFPPSKRYLKSNILYYCPDETPGTSATGVYSLNMDTFETELFESTKDMSVICMAGDLGSMYEDSSNGDNNNTLCYFSGFTDIPMSPTMRLTADGEVTEACKIKNSQILCVLQNEENYKENIYIHGDSTFQKKSVQMRMGVPFKYTPYISLARLYGDVFLGITGGTNKFVVFRLRAK